MLNDKEVDELLLRSQKHTRLQAGPIEDAAPDSEDTVRRRVTLAEREEFLLAAALKDDHAPINNSSRGVKDTEAATKIKRS